MRFSFVFVHGLNPTNDINHAYSTWTVDGIFWPQEFLPTHIENLRVLIYGYNSTVGSGVSTNGVREHATNLLEFLNAKRMVFKRLFTGVERNTVAND
jgi:hypothetical protein